MFGAQEKPLHELLSRSMVDLYVGPENTHWILHEKLLCHHSPFFRKIFYSKKSRPTSYKLPDDEDAPFKTFVGWLYSSSLPVPREEADLGLQYDLYLMAEKFQISNLIADVLQIVREWYKFSDTYPSLRRIQYVYANTEEGSPMRHMLVHSVARMVVLEKGIPAHWDKALRKNGQLAVDILKAIQDWRLDEDIVPDARDEPAESEELVDVDEETDKLDHEVEQEIEGEHSEQETENEQSNDDETVKEEDDSEATVINSPTSKKFFESVKDESVKNKFDQSKEEVERGTDKKFPISDVDEEFKKFTLGHNDYGTLQEV